jgi:hypothetical protein
MLTIKYVTGVLLSYYHSFNSPLYSYIVIQSFGIEVVDEVTVRCLEWYDILEVLYEADMF